MPGGWISRLSIGQKLVLSFSLILMLLAGSLSGLLFYLSRVNSYVDRHQRITVPGVVTASAILRHVGHMRTHVHRLLELRPGVDASSILDTLSTLEYQTSQALGTYRQHLAARTHPVLFDMLTQHGRVDLADQEDGAMAVIADGLSALAHERGQLQAALVYDPLSPALESSYEQTADRIESAVITLVEIHRLIDVEMKLEGDRLVNQAGKIVLILMCLLSALIVMIFALMRREVAAPLRQLASTATRVAAHDLTAQFDPWPSHDEVGALSASLTTMLTSLRDHSTALVRKTRELEAFTYSIAHDLKGPLREIEGFSSMLEKQFADSGDAQTTHYIDVIRQSALRLTRMIDALLKYSRLEQQELPRQQFNLGEMVRNLVRDRIDHMQDGKKPDIQIDLSFEELFGEPVSVHQALTNLFDNAIKFTRQQAHPIVRIVGRRTDKERILTVQDNGIGFDPAFRDKIFGLFERLHAPQEYEGTGVGLAIVKLVMDKHGGRIWAESTPGGGSAFHLAFPEQAP